VIAERRADPCGVNWRACRRRTLWVALCVTLSACQGERGNDPAMTVERNLESKDHGGLVLDLRTRQVVQPIGAELIGAARQKFVRIDVTDVRNPKRLRLTFEVRYRRDEGADVLLGTFALFPPDNPGEFLVATRGRLRDEGSIVVSMQVLDPVGPNDDVRVRLKPISFRAE
jgi:hypothetical protein